MATGMTGTTPCSGPSSDTDATVILAGLLQRTVR